MATHHEHYLGQQFKSLGYDRITWVSRPGNRWDLYLGLVGPHIAVIARSGRWFRPEGSNARWSTLEQAAVNTGVTVLSEALRTGRPPGSFVTHLANTPHSLDSVLDRPARFATADEQVDCFRCLAVMSAAERAAERIAMAETRQSDSEDVRTLCLMAKSIGRHHRDYPGVIRAIEVLRGREAAR